MDLGKVLKLWEQESNCPMKEVFEVEKWSTTPSYW
jgi:hypothetical protein